jgi:hypothetical protein
MPVCLRALLRGCDSGTDLDCLDRRRLEPNCRMQPDECGLQELLREGGSLMSAAAVPFVNPIPPFVVPEVHVVEVQDRTRPTPALERHYTVPQVSKIWGMAGTTVRRMFEDEEGVMRVGCPSRRVGRKLKRTYLTLYQNRKRTASDRRSTAGQTHLNGYMRVGDVGVRSGDGESPEVLCRVA